MDLSNKIETRSATISILGLGYVGLPLAVVFAEAGFRVVGIDLDQGRVACIQRGESYIRDVPSEVVSRLVTSTSAHPRHGHLSGVKQLGCRLSATGDFDALDEADVAIICVPTPLNKTKDPDLSYLMAAVEEVAKRLHPQMAVVLESTSYPGTTQEIILPRLETSNGRSLKAGLDFYLAFSPERIDPGRTDWGIASIPKVIGGVTPRCRDIVTMLYQCVVDEVVPVSSPKTAEIVKLLENTFRATNIALVNEFAIICDQLGVDVWEVIEAAKTKPFGFMPFYPGPGLGGHCIPIDPQYLAWKLRTLKYQARFIELADEINLGMPEYVVRKIASVLNEYAKPLRGSRILILGITYKPDVDDLRESPALDIIHMLVQQGADVTYHDPYVGRLEIDGLSMNSVALESAALHGSDCVVIVAPHRSYDWGWVVANSKLVFDTRNATAGTAGDAGRVVKL